MRHETMCRAWCLPLLLGLVLADGPEAKMHRYCIVGAGPAGVQLGHFMMHAGRDYVTFEQNLRAGSFFEVYPRHRRLISLNKRKVREGRSSEFAFRHDWNTLIDLRRPEDRPKPVTERSKELFPKAGVLADYLVEFAEEQRDRIYYNSTVKMISRVDGSADFLIEVAREGGDQLFRCGEVILANGLTRPRGAAIIVDGSKYLTGYEELPETGEEFEGKAVIVLGMGNAAMETAQELQKYTSEVHLLARERKLPDGSKGIRFAWQTHYVGDIRAGRTTILDTYLLKSLDTFDFNGLSDNKRLVIIPCISRFCVWQVDLDDCGDKSCRKLHTHAGQNLKYRLDVARVLIGTALHRRLENLVSQYDSSEFELKDEQPDDEDFVMSAATAPLGVDPDVFDNRYQELTVSSTMLRQHPALADELAEVRMVAGSGNLRYPMDSIIRAFGWVMDLRFLDQALNVSTTHRRKYPSISHSWDVTGVPGLYAAGTISHSLDFQKSAGGFIHGFRYTARALFRLLEERNFAVPWPQVSFELPAEKSSCSKQGEGSPPRINDAQAGAATGSCLAGGVRMSAVEPIVTKLFERINEASGPYQMFEFLGDMLLFEHGAGNWTARYLEEVPLEHFHERYQDTPRLTWVFKYNEHFHGQKVLGQNRVGATKPEEAHNSNFLHPHLSFFPAGTQVATMRHWLVEDIFTQWTSPDDIRPMMKFLTRVVTASMGQTSR